MGVDKGQLFATIDHLSRRQWGHVTRAQLLAAGVQSRTITYWINTCRLIRVHAGVYALGHINPHPIARTIAAVLACGPRAAASHRSAAALWGLGPFPSMPEVSAPSKHNRPGIITHRARTLTRTHIRRQHGVPVTSVPRTILDLAPRLSDEDLVRMIDDARDRAILGPSQLADLTAASPRIKRLTDPRHNPTKSRFEQRFLSLCRHHGLPTPQTNVAILPGIKADILFESEQVIVELDSWRHHSSHASFIADRARDRRTTAAGFVTLRYTWEAVTADHAAAAQEVARVLAARG